MKLFLDDIRTPPENWTVARSYNEAIECLKTRQVTDLSLDHDLGEDRTGYDVLNWIEKMVYEDPTFPVPNCSMHTSNPVGKQNMERCLNSIHKRLSENRTCPEIAHGRKTDMAENRASDFRTVRIPDTSQN